VANGHHTTILRHVHALFDIGTLGGRTDRQLLDQFRAGGASAEPAFAALVERHGPMVLHVCRTSLCNPHDIEDAFQATFLVLVRRAGSLWVRDSLGPWLHSVACRVVRQSRTATARRQAHERRAAERAAAVDDGPLDSIDRADLGLPLHEELCRLPDRYRAPLVLCYLEGLTHEQAAEQLRCPVGTVRSRLARGRERLRSRLVRRGLTPSLNPIGIGLADHSPQALVPPTWIEKTVGAAISLEAGRDMPPLVSASVLKLVKGVIGTMFLTKLKALGASFLFVVVVGAGVGVLARQDAPKVEDRYASGAPKFPVPDQGERFAPSVQENSPWEIHRIPAPPGARVHIRVETTDGKVTSCDAIVRGVGRLDIMENVVDPKGDVRQQTRTTGTGILVYAGTSHDQPATKEDPFNPLPKGVLANVPPAGLNEPSNHERRLREVERKLERVLNLLEARTKGVQPSYLNEPAQVK
jgi:RNA polymerase sigma factor (sigma-70 family)